MSDAASSVTVVYVDDEPDFAELVSSHLQRHDGALEVETHGDAKTALEALREDVEAVDCVVSDYEMPGMDGIDFLEAVRAEWPDLPFVLFTGRGSEDIASEAISAGVTEYMQKATDPQQFEVLANRVRNAVEMYETERALERTETRYRRLVEQNLTGIYIVQDGEIRYANPKCEETFGYDRGELVGVAVEELVADGDVPTVREHLRRAETGEVEELNYTASGVRSDGEHFEFEVHSGRIDHEGEPAVLGSLVDVTEQRRRERELEEYRELVETVADPMYVLDDVGCVEKANRAMAELLDYDHDELLGTNAREFLPDDDYDEGTELIREFIRGEREPPETFEVEFVTAGGERVPCEANLTVLTDEEESFRGTVGVARIIAERKERERELEEYETIVETAPDGIFILDDDGYFLGGNDTGAEMVGKDRENVVGLHFSTLVEEGVVDETVVDRYTTIVEELLSGGSDRQKAKLEATLSPQNGGERTCEVHIALLPEGGGEYRGTVGVVRDITERKAIEEALRGERDRLSALFENIPEPTLVYEFVDGEPIVRRVNDAFEEVFGYGSPLVVGEPLDEYIVPEDNAGQALDLNNRVLAGEQLDVELQRETADGELRDFLLRNAPIPTDAGAQGYAIYTDITERKRDEERVQALFEYSTDPIVETELVDAVPYVRRVNSSFEEVFGYDGDELAGEPLDEYIVPDGEQDAAIDINARVHHGRAVEEEVTRVAADGTREFLLRSIPYEVEAATGVAPSAVDGTRTYSVYTDITERKERERRLNRLHEATRELVEGASREEVAHEAVAAAREILGLDVTGLYRMDEETEVLEPVAVTDRAEELLGTLPAIGRGEGLAWWVYQMGDPLVTDDVRTVENVHDPDTPVRSEMILPVGDYGVFMAASTEVGAFDETQHSLARVLVSNVEAALDRARRESLLRDREQALLRQNERLEEFAGVVSHDLRSPLTVAKGNVYLLRESGGEEYLDKIEDALDRMEQLIEDLLTLARRGETVDEPTAVDVPALVDEAWSTVDTGDASLSMAEEVRGVVEADRGRLRELLENLFSNAVEHGGDGVTVTVGGLEDGFYVEDDGEGLDEQARENLFEPGFSSREGGTGFGLSIVRQIAEAHGWSVAVAESEDGGARFEFTGVDVAVQREA